MRYLLQQLHLSTQRDGQCHVWHLGPCREREEVSQKLTGSLQPVYKLATTCHCSWLAEHNYLWTTSRVFLTRVAHQESKLLMWLRLSARLVNRDKDLVATTDAHHRPVRVHALRPGKGLQAKQSESLRAQDSAIQNQDQNRNGHVSQFIQSPLCTKPYSTSKINIRQLWSQHLQSVSHDIPPISCRKIDR